MRWYPTQAKKRLEWGTHRLLPVHRKFELRHDGPHNGAQRSRTASGKSSIIGRSENTSTPGTKVVELKTVWFHTVICVAPSMFVSVLFSYSWSAATWVQSTPLN